MSKGETTSLRDGGRLEPHPTPDPKRQRRERDRRGSPREEGRQEDVSRRTTTEDWGCSWEGGSEHEREEVASGKGSDTRNGEPGPPRHRPPTTPNSPNVLPDTPLPCETRDMAPISENLSRGFQSGRRSQRVKPDSCGGARRRTRVPATVTRRRRSSRRTSRRTSRAKPATARPRTAGGYINQSLLRPEGGRGLSVRQQARNVRLEEQRVRTHNGSSHHGILMDVSEVRRKMGQVKLMPLQAHKSLVGSRDGCLMGQTLRQGRDQRVEKLSVQRRETLQANKPQEA